MSQATYHPLEEILRLIARNSPHPWYPRQFLRESRADPDQVSAILEQLALEGLIEKVRGGSLESGSGVVLTELGHDVVRDTALMDRLIRGEILRPDDVGAIIRSDLRTAGPPYVTYALIAVNVLIFFAINDRSPLYDNWTAFAGKIKAGEWWRLMTCTFLHGNLIHLGMNMFSLYMVGSFVEQAWGRWRFLGIYLVAGWAGSCLAMGMQPERGVVGASGAVFGVLGAVGVWFLLYRNQLPPGAARSGLWQVVMVVVINVVYGLMRPNISNWGHLGGGIGGVLAAVVMHIQRFGLPGVSMKSPALRGGIAAVLLLILPAASYLQMKNAWAKTERPLARQDDDDKDDKPAKDKAKEIDLKLARAFNRHHQALGDINREIHTEFKNMPRSPKDIKDEPEAVQQATRAIEKQRKALLEQKELLEDAPSQDEYIERTRKAALESIKSSVELCDQVLAHLNEPTSAGQKRLTKTFNDFVDQANALNRRLKVLRERGEKADEEK